MIPDEVIAAINAYGLQLRSGRFVLRSETVFLVPHHNGAGPGAVTTREEEFAFDGLRSRLARTRRLGHLHPGQPYSLQETLCVFDGEKVTRSDSTGDPLTTGTEVSVPTDLARELPTLIGTPAGLLGRALVRSQVWQTPPLGDELRSVYQAELVGEEEVAGLRCLHLVGPVEADAGWQLTRSWWVAPEKGYALVQYQEDFLWIPPVSSLGKRHITTAEKWMQVEGGIWLPEVSVSRTYGKPVGDVEKLYRVETTTILAAAVNIPIGDDVFTAPTQ